MKPPCNKQINYSQNGDKARTSASYFVQRILQTKIVSNKIKSDVLWLRLVIQVFLAKNHAQRVRQVIYSPGLALCDFCLYSNLKITLKGKWFEWQAEIIIIATDEVHSITREDLKMHYQKWKNSRKRYVTSQVTNKGEYFESDWII